VHGIEFLRDVLTEGPEEAPPSLDAVLAISPPFSSPPARRFHPLERPVRTTWKYGRAEIQF
jgi:hypothetical protein